MARHRLSLASSVVARACMHMRHLTLQKVLMQVRGVLVLADGQSDDAFHV